MSMGLQERRGYLRAHDRRVNLAVFDELAAMTAEEWAALERTGEFPIDAEVILTLEREGSDGRAALRRLVARLGPAPTVADLDRLSKKDWKTLSKKWGASPTDWNHMRRALSAVLSTLFGTHRYPFRYQVVDRIPLRKEKERVPDLSPEKLAEIVANLPECVRYFPWFLVLSGVRIGEFLRLERSHLRPHSFTIAVPGTKTDGSDRTVFVGKAHWWVVDAAVPCYLTYGQVRRHWIAACAAAGVTRVTLHDLRHCSGQWAILGGADEGALQDHLGHERRETTNKYTRMVNQGRAAEALSDFVQPFVNQ
jgi:integrase